MADGGSGDKLGSEKELVEAERLLLLDPSKSEHHAKRALVADKTNEKAYVCAAKAALLLDDDDRANKYMLLGRSRCPNSKELQIMFESIKQIKKQLVHSFLSPPEPKVPAKPSVVQVAQDPVQLPPKSAKEMMFASLREGSEALEIQHFKIAIESYKKALEYSKNCKKEEKPEKARKYALSIAYIGQGNYESLVSAMELLKPLKGRTFPAAFYGMALVFEKFNRYKLLLDETKAGQQLLSRLSNDPDRFCWPGKTNLIEETQKSVLSVKLKELQEKYTLIPKPDAVCRLPQCLQLSSHIYPSDAIFHTDPDFAGYFITICEEKCRIAFHISCWKHLKEQMSDSVKMSDKDMLGTKCLTDGCRTGYYKPRDSIIIRIIVIDSNNKIKAEMERERSEDPIPPPPPKPAAIQKKPRKKPDRPFVPKPPVPAKAALHPTKKTKRNGPYKKDSEDGDGDGHDPEADLQAAIASLEFYRETNFNRNMNRVFDPRYQFYGNEGIKRTEYLVPDLVDDGRLESERKHFYRMYHNYLETVGSSARWQLTKFMKERGYCQQPGYFIEENGTAAIHLVKSPMFACIDDKYCLAERVNLMYYQVKNDLVTNMQKILGTTATTTNPTKQDVNLAAPKMNPIPIQSKTSPSGFVKSVQSGDKNKVQQSEKDKTIVTISNIEATKKNNANRNAPPLLDLQYKPINLQGSTNTGTQNNVSSTVIQSGSLSPDNKFKVNEDLPGLNVKNQEESDSFKNPFLEELERKGQSNTFFSEDSDSSTDEVIVPHKEKDLDLFAGLETKPDQEEKTEEKDENSDDKTVTTENIARGENFSVSSDSMSFSSAQDTSMPALQSDLDIHEISTETLSQSEEDSSPNAHQKMKSSLKRRRSSKSDILLETQLPTPTTLFSPPIAEKEFKWPSSNTVVPVKSEEIIAAAADDDAAKLAADSEWKLKYKTAQAESKLAHDQLLEAKRKEVNMQLAINDQQMQLSKIQNENKKLLKRLEQQEIQLQQMKVEKAREKELYEKCKKTLEATRGVLSESQIENESLKTIKSVLELSTSQLEPQLVNSQRRLAEVLLNYWNYVMKHYNDLSLNNVAQMYSAVQYLSTDSNPSVQDLFVAIKEWDDLIGTVNDLNKKFTEKMGPYRALLKNGKPADKKLLSIEIPKPPTMPTYMIGELLQKDLNTKGSIFGVKPASCSVSTQTKSRRLEQVSEQSSSLLRSASTSNVSSDGATLFTNGHRISPLTIGNQQATSMSSNALELSAAVAARPTLVPTPPMSRPYVPIPMPGEIARPMSPQIGSFARPTTPLGPIARPSSSQINSTVNSFGSNPITRPAAPPPFGTAQAAPSTTLRQPSAATTGITVTLPKPTPMTNGTSKPVPTAAASNTAKPISMAAALKGAASTKLINGVTSKTKSAGMKPSSYDSLVKLLLDTHTYSTTDDLREALAKVRERNNNKLTGLTREEIARRVADILVEFLIERPLPDSERSEHAKILYTADGQADECVICLQAKREGYVFTLSCKHGFHPKCIRRWLQQERHCPVCRFNVLQSTRYNDVEFPPLRN